MKPYYTVSAKAIVCISTPDMYQHFRAAIKLTSSLSAPKHVGSKDGKVLELHTIHFEMKNKTEHAVHSYNAGQGYFGAQCYDSCL